MDLKRQIEELRQGGLSILFRKIRTIVSIVFESIFVVMALPLAVFVRILAPIVTIRFGALSSARIGHFALNTEIYLCERDTGIYGYRAIDIFYNRKPICNYQLKKMWDRALFALPFAKLLDRANCLLPGSERHMVPMRADYPDVDVHGLLGRTKPHIFFTPEEERSGEKALRGLGIPDGASFVCFHARDSAYLSKTLLYEKWDYHQYRDCDICNCIMAMEEVVRRGYYAIRMGAVVKKALPVGGSRIIDYAVSGRTDFLDIFLSARCRFFLCSTAGISSVPMIFRRPVALVNFLPIGYIVNWNIGGLLIPKKLWLRGERRFLTFREMIGPGIGMASRSEEYEKMGIEVIENTPEEIAALAIEMDERLKESWKETAEDSALQERFRLLYGMDGSDKLRLPLIGSDFLRQNIELLG